MGYMKAMYMSKTITLSVDNTRKVVEQMKTANMNFSQAVNYIITTWYGMKTMIDKHEENVKIDNIKKAKIVKESPKHEADYWYCRKCNFRNKKEYKKCFICGTKK